MMSAAFYSMLSCICGILSLVSCQEFHMSSYILTQYALDDAPTRYADWITQALDVLNSQPLSDYDGSTHNCWFGGYSYKLYLSRASYAFTLDESTLSLYITDHGFHSGAVLQFSADIPVYAGGYVGKAFVCWHETDCRDDMIHVSTTIVTSGNVSIVRDDATGGSTVTPEIEVAVTDLKYDISNCKGWSVQHLESWFHDTLAREMTDIINEKIDENVASITQSLNTPQTFEPYDGVQITYNLTELEFASREYAKMSAIAILRARNTNDDWYVYQDPDTAELDASFAPPSAWPASPFYQTYNNATAGLYLLNGLRLSSTLFQALMWAADRSGQLNPNYSFAVLDATLLFEFRWSLPLMKIPENDTLVLVLEYGIINGTCFETGGDVSDRHTVIDFKVYNLTGNASIGINGRDTMNIHVDQFDLDNVDLSLTAPPIPLPENVINALLKEVVNATVPYLNDWLAAHALNIPPDIRDYLPNPVLSVVHQNIEGRNHSEHGYIELLSACACAPDALFSPCTNLQCELPTITPSPTAEPSVSPTVSPSPAPTLSPTVAPTPYRNYTTPAPTQLPNTNCSVWLHLFDGPTMLAFADYDICALQQAGDEQVIVRLANTDGVCELMAGAPLFQGLTDWNHYQLDMDVASNSIALVSLFCDSSCSSCAYARDRTSGADDIDFGVCYNNISVLRNPYNIMFMQYNISAISSTDICIGGNAKSQSNDSMIWLSYPYATDCDSYSVSLQHVGALNACIPIHDSGYNQLTSFTNEFGNATFYAFFSGCNASCSAPSCSSNQTLQYNTCSAYYNSSSKFIFSSDLQVCGHEVQYNVVNGTTAAPTAAPRNSFIDDPSHQTILIVVVCAAVLLLVVAVVVCIWCRKRKSVDSQSSLSASRDKILASCSNTAQRVLSSFGCSVGRLTQQEIIETFGMLLCAALLMWQADVWRASSPWRIFTIEAFEKLGVDMSYLDASHLTSTLSAWTDLGYYMSTVFSSLCFFVVLVRLILVLPESTSVWTACRIFVLFGYLISHFFLWVGPSLYYDFKEAIHIETANMTNTTLQASQEVINGVDTMLGYAFVGIFVSYLANLMLFWINSIPVACYIMSVIFIIRQFNDDNQGTFGFISYDLDVEPKVQLFTRLQVCLCMFQGLSAIIQALPVIILYQSFGVDVGWVVLWCFWWTFPLLLLWQVTVVLRRYIIQLKHPHRAFAVTANVTVNDGGVDAHAGDNTGLEAKRKGLLWRFKKGAKYNVEEAEAKQPEKEELEPVPSIANVQYQAFVSLSKLRQQLWINIALYFVAFVVTVIVAVEIEKGYASDMDFQFVECNIVTTFLLTAMFAFCALNEMFELHEKSSLAHQERVADDEEEEVEDDEKEYVPPKRLFMFASKRNKAQLQSEQLELQETVKKEHHVHPPPRAPSGHDIDNPFKAATDFDLERPSIYKRPSIWKETGWCHACNSCLRWLFEKQERAHPYVYGERVLYRRMFLLVGTLGFGYSVLHQLYDIFTTTVKEEVVTLLESMDLDVVWPDNQHGGTIFDDAFEMYNTARKVELAFATSSFGFFAAATLFDICGRNKKGLMYSRLFSWLSIVLIFISMLSTALPNYLTGTDITSITPFCASNFNQAIYLMAGDIVGILCSAIFTYTLLPVLISVPPSLVRATFMVLHESHLFELSQHQINSLVSIIIVASFLTPLITFFPLLVFQQLMGDNVTAALILIGWIGPILVSFMYRSKKYGIKCSVLLYELWLLLMLGSIVGIIVYEFTIYGVPQFFVDAMKEFITYTEFTAEVFLSNVVISDFLYANILAFKNL